MTLTELLNEVYVLTNRPDLVPETLSAVRASTLKMHQSDYYYKDIAQGVINLQYADYSNVFDTSLLQRYRAMKAIRKWAATGINQFTQQPTGKAGKFLSAVDIAEALDSYGRDRTDVYYVAGTSVNMNLSDNCATFLVSWYQQPSIDPQNFVSWVAVDHPYAIVFDAACAVFKLIGYDEQSTRYSNLVAEQVAILKMSNIEAEGR